MITSIQNPKIQQIRGLLSRRKEREEAGAFIAEGVRLLEEACSAGWKPELVLYCQQLSPRGLSLVDQFNKMSCPMEEVSPHIMEALAGTQSPQGILAVFADRTLPLPNHLNCILIVDNLRDPGNLGALLRTALAAKVQAVLLSAGTVDAFAPKIVRAAMGAHFHIPILFMDWEQIHHCCKQQAEPPLQLYLAEANEGVPCWQLDLTQPVGLIIGGEAEGASPQARQSADGLTHIPMPGQSESLNAAVAGSILMFEIVRQRYQKDAKDSR